MTHGIEIGDHFVKTGPNGKKCIYKVYRLIDAMNPKHGGMFRSWLTYVCGERALYDFHWYENNKGIEILNYELVRHWRKLSPIEVLALQT